MVCKIMCLNESLDDSDMYRNLLESIGIEEVLRLGLKDCKWSIHRVYVNKINIGSILYIDILT